MKEAEMDDNTAFELIGAFRIGTRQILNKIGDENFTRRLMLATAAMIREVNSPQQRVEIYRWAQNQAVEELGRRERQKAALEEYEDILAAQDLLEGVKDVEKSS